MCPQKSLGNTGLKYSTWSTWRRMLRAWSRLLPYSRSDSTSKFLLSLFFLPFVVYLFSLQFYGSELSWPLLNDLASVHTCPDTHSTQEYGKSKMWTILTFVQISNHGMFTRRQRRDLTLLSAPDGSSLQCHVCEKRPTAAKKPSLPQTMRRADGTGEGATVPPEETDCFSTPTHLTAAAASLSYSVSFLPRRYQLFTHWL